MAKKSKKNNSNNNTTLDEESNTKTNNNNTIDTIINEERLKNEIELKNYVSPVIYNCLRNVYDRELKYGYVMLIGGEAINQYLPDDKKVLTSDFDIKYVVHEQYNDDIYLKKANSARMRIMIEILKCLQEMKPPKGYKLFYPKLGLIFHPFFRIIYRDDKRGYLYQVCPKTGEEVGVNYKFNKVFKIKIYYQKDDELLDFDILDCGLFYRKTDAYSFFERTIYDTFMRAPFNMTIPVPFNVRDRLRIAKLKYLILDNFRMVLIMNDMLIKNKSNPVDLEKAEKKIPNYWLKVNNMLSTMSNTNKIDTLQQKMKDVEELYKPLAYYNFLCYSNDNLKYGTQLLKKEGCDETYVKNLNEFKKKYLEIYNYIAKL
jgi:hypothetical protein